ncbi:hypothetical protein AAG570_000606, partial [Ranatra chinensis]
SSRTSQGKLPPPSFCGSTIAVENSVFINPFVEAENAEKAVLEKHVKMIPIKESITSINGKKICWMYRKGRCRFGHNCKYAHDSDLFSTAISTTAFDEHNESGLKEPSEKNNFCSTTSSEDNMDKKRKKRPGLCQGLKPGKRIMKMYKKQKNE